MNPTTARATPKTDPPIRKYVGYVVSGSHNTIIPNGPKVPTATANKSRADQNAVDPATFSCCQRRDSGTRSWMKNVNSAGNAPISIISRQPECETS